MIRSCAMPSNKKKVSHSVPDYAVGDRDGPRLRRSSRKVSPGSSPLALATGLSCGLPDHITCSITYSMYPVFGGQNADHQLTFGWNQILDGAASMVGNSQRVRHMCERMP